MNDDEADEGATELHLRAGPRPPPQSFVVTIIEGPDAGLTVELPQGARVLVGQSPVCEIRLKDARVSRRHASLEVDGDRLHLVDLRSTNGVFVNGVSIGEAYLHGNETVVLGASRMQARRNGGASDPQALSPANHFGDLRGGSPEMRRLYPLCERVAASDVPVVIEGETGTGKEVLAEAIHQASPRAQGPFVVFDCTTVAANLMESELFGHEKGAFTGAGATRKGMFEQAGKGTLLIDEIGDLELGLQAKLLRAVERHEVRRIGGDRSLRVDVRVLAATRRDLDREVQAGRFRDDLFHRLAVTRIELPPLRRRRGDVRELADRFFAEYGVVPPDDLIAKWEDLPWPGNVRELRNAVARWVAVGELAPAGYETGSNRSEKAAALVSDILALNLPLTQARQRLVESFERSYVEKILAENGGHVGRAAAAAGIGRRYFQMLLAKHT